MVPVHLADVFDSIGEGATSLDAVAISTQRTAGAVLAAVGELAGLGLVVDDGAQVRRA